MDKQGTMALMYCCEMEKLLSPQNPPSNESLFVNLLI